MIVHRKFVYSSVCVSIWLTEHVRENNVCSLLYLPFLPIICACSKLTIRVKGARQRKQQYRELALLKRAWDGSMDGSDEQTDQCVTVALSVCPSLLLANKLVLFTSPRLSSEVLKKDKKTARAIETRDARVLTSQYHLHNLCRATCVMHTQTRERSPPR